MLTRFDDCQQALSDPRLSNARIASYDAHLRSRGEQTGVLAASLQQWAVFNDPPRHTELRLMVAKAFGARSMERLRPQVGAIVESLIDGFIERGEADLVQDFAVPLPTRVIAHLLGVPPEDAPLLKQWSDELATFVGTSLTVADRRERATAAVQEFRRYFAPLVARYRAEPEDNLVSVVGQATIEGREVSEVEVADIALSILFAGHETTTHLIANGIRQLVAHEGSVEAVATGQVAAEVAVEELLRFDGPVNGVARLVRERYELRGAVLEPGQRLFCMLGAANRDPERFDEPDTFRLARGDTRHLAFGHGPHFCLGALLARTEARLAIPALCRRLTGLRVPLESNAWVDSLVLRGMSTLPATFEPGPRHRGDA
jgi:cytochrome P450